jgi:TldD protein
LKRAGCFLFLLAVAASAQTAASTTAGDPILRAMRDEIERSRKLTVPNLESPYFIQYVLDDAETFAAAANLGGLISVRHNHLREPEVHVRVGTYQFDNTNFPGAGFGGRYDLGRFPLDNSYPVMRRYFWLATDAAYKNAVEQLSRKRAAMRNLQSTETPDDFAHAEPVELIRAFQPLAIDEAEWTRRVRSLSALFSAYPQIKDSRVDFDASAGGLYLANSEGTAIKAPEDVLLLRVQAAAQASDGMTVRDAAVYLGFNQAGMLSSTEMERGVKDMAETVVRLAAAPKGEDYSGPVLFEGAASPQLFAELLGKNLALGRRPDGARGAAGPVSELEGRMGARVLPDSFTVVDDPTQKEWRGRPLFGSYEVDREGVAAKPVRLIEKGVLKGYLLTRQPVRGFPQSNGRARMDGAFGASTAGISNLFVTAGDAVPAAQMKQKLIELIQQRGKPYGLIVRKLDFPAVAPADELRRLIAGSPGVAHPLSAPTLVYKVFPDGHEELVRGMRFHGVNLRSLKDILAAGDDSTVFEFMDSAAPFAMTGAGGFTAEACVVAPSILVDDLDLQPAEDEQPKPPVVSAPPLTR